MPETALLDVRVLPWRLRARVMNPSAFRDGVSNMDPFGAVDDLGGLVFGLVFWIVLIVAAPLIVLILAALLFSIELPIILAIAVILVVIRFAGVVPWDVVTINQITRHETHESYRNIVKAVRRIREINGDRRVRVRWAWMAKAEPQTEPPTD